MSNADTWEYLDVPQYTICFDCVHLRIGNYTISQTYCPIRVYSVDKARCDEFVIRHDKAHKYMNTFMSCPSCGFNHSTLAKCVGLPIKYPEQLPNK